MNKFIYVILAIVLTIPNTSFANNIECKFRNWKGAQTEDAAISWIGTGFIIDENKMRLRRVFPSGKNGEWQSVSKKETKKFDTYVFYKTDTYKGSKLKTRYGYRVYNNGKCNAVQTDNKYTPIQADGRTDY